MKYLALLLTLLPATAHAASLKVKDPFVPLAPPGAMAHAAYMTLTNEAAAPVQLIGVRAEGYRMAHLHLSEETDGVATMSAVGLIELAPAQSLALARGGLHIMLMGPEGPVVEGQMIPLELEYADGTSQTIFVPVRSVRHGS